MKILKNNTLKLNAQDLVTLQVKCYKGLLSLKDFVAITKICYDNKNRIPEGDELINKIIILLK